MFAGGLTISCSFGGDMRGESGYQIF